MRIILLTLTLILATFTIHAQRYITAGGLRLGEPFGLTVQQYIGGQNTIEGMITYHPRRKESELNVLFEKHNKLLGKRLNYYLGIGPYLGTKSVESEDNTSTNNAYLGTSLIGGLEFSLKNTVISFDYKPGINMLGGDGLMNHHTAISLRYIFIKPKKKERNWKFWEKWKR